MVGIVSPGFSGRRRAGGEQLPSGQYLVTDFPVLPAGPTPRVDTGSWELRAMSRPAPTMCWRGPTAATPPTCRWRSPAVFVCGPTGFVETAADLLIAAGYGPRTIKTERFGPSGGQP